MAHCSFSLLTCPPTRTALELILKSRDVDFRFPSQNITHSASASALSSSSPYLAKLLARKSRDLKMSLSPPAVEGEESAVVEDSDSEDPVPLAQQVRPLEPGPRERTRQVTCTGFAPRTFEAILPWLAGDKTPLSWSPLHSRADLRRKHVVRKDDCSAKSVYRLAKLLEVEDLAQAALREFARQLAVENVLIEAKSMLARDWPEVKAVVDEFVAKHQAEVDAWAVEKGMSGLDVSDKPVAEVASGDTSA